MPPPTRHKCEWYPIAFDPSEVPYKPVLWACGAQWRCIKTMTRKRMLTDPPDAIPVPTTGMWGVIKDKPPEDTTSNS